MKKLLYLVVSVFIIACNNDDNDSTAPVVTLIGEPSITVSQSSTYVDSGATAIDNQDGDLTSSIVTTSNVDTSTLGAYTVVHSVSDAAGNVGSASRQVDVGMSNINVLWQSAPAWDSITAMKVAAINPAKLIISISGGINPSPPPSAGPSETQLIQFITDLTTHGYTGELVMHPDVNKEDWLHFWSPHPWVVHKACWKLYIDYYKKLNIALHAAGQKQMTELLIETGNGTTMPHTTTEALNDLFTSFKTYMNDIGLDPSINKLSATGDWLSNYFPTSADYYYAQMYDMCSQPEGSAGVLCGENIPDTSGERAQLIAESMVQFIMAPSPNGIGNNSRGLDKVSFIFTYAPHATTNPPPPGGYNSPMFGEVNNFWTKSQFTNFIWWFKTKMNVHYPNANTGIWHSEVITEPAWYN